MVLMVLDRFVLIKDDNNSCIVPVAFAVVGAVVAALLCFVSGVIMLVGMEGLLLLLGFKTDSWCCSCSRCSLMRS